MKILVYRNDDNGDKFMFEYVSTFIPRVGDVIGYKTKVFTVVDVIWLGLDTGDPKVHLRVE